MLKGVWLIFIVGLCGSKVVCVLWIHKVIGSDPHALARRLENGGFHHCIDRCFTITSVGESDKPGVLQELGYPAHKRPMKTLLRRHAGKVDFVRIEAHDQDCLKVSISSSLVKAVICYT